MSSAPRSVARFGLFELDLTTGELRKNDRPVRLQPQPSQVLLLLVERAGELVTREELQERVWGDGTVVAYDQGLNYCVRQVRAALGDQADTPAFVETVPRRGYRFLAPVERVEVAEGAPVPSASPRPSFRHLPGWAVAAAAGVVIAVAALIALRGPSEADDPTAGSPADRVRLVVLPLVDLSQQGPESGPAPGDPYLADSLTEELITHLGRLEPERLGVISRVSAMTYKDADKTVAQIGDELDVRYVLEGSIRRAGSRLRISVQLIQVGDQTHLWAETYDRDFADVLAIQSDIARRVTRSLALRLLPEKADSLVRRTTANPEAYDAFLQGRYQWNRFTTEGYLAAVEHFRRALALDPEFAEAWAALADAHNLLAFTDALPQEEAFEHARAAARHALALDPELAEAHNSLAFVLLYHDWDPRSAVAEFERALELAPGYAMGHHWAAAAYGALGRFDEAIAAARRAAELDPVSLSVRADLGWYHLIAGQWQQALTQCNRALDLSPGYGFAEYCRDRARLGLGQPVEEATSEETRREALTAQAAGEDVHPLGMAWGWAALGETDEAFRWLDLAVESRDPWMVFLWVDQRFEPLWDDPRLNQVAARVGVERPGAFQRVH